VVIEVVSDKIGQEVDEKLKKYTKIGVKYYVIFDPAEQLSKEQLQIYALNVSSQKVGVTPTRPLGPFPQGSFPRNIEQVPLNDKGVYEKTNQPFFPEVGLGLMRWKGKYQGITTEWLRWCDSTGSLILTGAECAKRAREATERAEQARQRAEQALLRAERLAAQLRALGIEL